MAQKVRMRLDVFIKHECKTPQYDDLINDVLNYCISRFDIGK